MNLCASDTHARAVSLPAFLFFLRREVEKKLLAKHMEVWAHRCILTVISQESAVHLYTCARHAPTVSLPAFLFFLRREVEKKLLAKHLDVLMQDVVACRTAVIDEAIIAWAKQGIKQVGACWCAVAGSRMLRMGIA